MASQVNDLVEQSKCLSCYGVSFSEGLSLAMLMKLSGGATPPAPVATAATVVKVRGLTANWNAVAGVDGYYLDVSTAVDFSSFVAGYNGYDAGTSLTKIITGLNPATTYYYRVRSYVGASQSANSNVITTLTVSGMEFTITLNASVTPPVITAATLANGDFLWTRPDTTTTATKTPAAAFFNASGAYTLTCTDWSKVTVIDFHQSALRNWLNTTNLTALLPSLTGLTVLQIYRNSAYADVFSGWVLPASLTFFRIGETLVSGDIGGWVLPASLTYFNLIFTSVSGDISGWVLPASLANFEINSTSVSGDVSGWTLPASLVTFYINSTSIHYVSSGGAFTGATNSDVIQCQDCAWPQAQVDNALADCDTSGAINGALNASGTNSTPSAAGLVSKANLVGKGWTVTTT